MEINIIQDFLKQVEKEFGYVGIYYNSDDNTVIIEQERYPEPNEKFNGSLEELLKEFYKDNHHVSTKELNESDLDMFNFILNMEFETKLHSSHDLSEIFINCKNEFYDIDTIKISSEYLSQHILQINLNKRIIYYDTNNLIKQSHIDKVKEVFEYLEKLHYENNI